MYILYRHNVMLF